MKTIIAVFVFLCAVFNGNALLLHGSQSNTTSTSIGQVDPSIQHQLQQLTTGLNSALVTALKQENQLLQQQQQINELKQKLSEQQHSALELEVQSLKEDVQKLKTLNQTTEQRIALMEDSLHKLQSENKILKDSLNSLNVTAQTSQQTITFLEDSLHRVKIENQVLKGELNNINVTAETSQQRILFLEDSLNKVQRENKDLMDDLNSFNATSQELKIESQITHNIVQKIKTQDQDTGITRNMSASLQSQQHQLRYLSLSLMDIQNQTNAQISRLEDQQNQTLMAEIQQLKNTFHDTTTNINASVWSILTDLGHRVAFTAGIISGGTHSFFDGQTVKYSTVLYQVGGGYDPSTGIFTAPRSGLYIIACTAVADDRHSFWTRIVVNGYDKAGMIVLNNTNINILQSASNLIVQQLNVGDRVWIKVYLGDQMLVFSDVLQNTFSVILIN